MKRCNSIISIITVNLNNFEGLKSTIESVIKQTDNRFEFIVIDGDSNDGSKVLLLQNSSIITKWISEKDKGIYDAMNKGVSLSKGEWIYFLNSGDILFDENTITEMLYYTVKYSNKFLIYGNLHISGLYEKNHLIKYSNVNKYYLLNNCIGQQAILFKKELFSKIGNFKDNLKIVGDYEFLLRAFFKFKKETKHIDTVFSIYQWGGISNKKSFEQDHKKERDTVISWYYTKFQIRLFRNKYFSLLYKKKYLGKVIKLLLHYFFEWKI